MLPPGMHEFKYFVDNAWCKDVHGSEMTPNSFGTSNDAIDVEEKRPLLYAAIFPGKAAGLPSQLCLPEQMNIPSVLTVSIHETKQGAGFFSSQFLLLSGPPSVYNSSSGSEEMP
jgi:hypothetical protein